MKRLLAMIIVIAVLTVFASCVQVSTPQSQDSIASNYPVTSSNYENDRTDSVSQSNEYEEVESYCKSLVSRGDYLTAYTFIKDKANNDSAYNSLLQKYVQVYVDSTIKTAMDYADKGSYQQAIYILQEANKIYNCSEFSSKIEEFNAFLPCKLSFCQRVDSEDYEYMLNAEDCFGNHYSEVFGFGESLASEDGGYAVFYLNGKYKNLCGIFVGSNELYKDMEVQCRIYSDGKLIYESAKLGRTSLPVNINLDITGTELLRIEYIYYTWWTNDPGCIFDLTVS